MRGPAGIGMTNRNTLTFDSLLVIRVQGNRERDPVVHHNSLEIHRGCAKSGGELVHKRMEFPQHCCTGWTREQSINKASVLWKVRVITSESELWVELRVCEEVAVGVDPVSRKNMRPHATGSVKGKITH